jgi:HSP20 family protein
MADRRSFFERLTGTSRVAEETVEEAPATEIPVREEEQPASAPVSAEEQEGQLTVDVYQTPEAIVIKSTIAGVRPEDLDVSITNDMVTIRGTRRHDEEVREEDYFYRECYWGSFSRSIILPVDIVAEKADASLKDGILTIRIPKAEALVTKRVKVRGF